MKCKLLLALSVLALSLPAFAASPNDASGQFTVTEPTLVPGLTLQPGTYSIKVMDHLQDRFVVRVEGTNGSPHALFIAVPAKSMKTGTGKGVVDWSGQVGAKAAIRGFVFGSNLPSVEFVYPKDDAVSIAKANDASSVLAVDPASEGKPAELNKLNEDEMQMVTLWMLTPQRVSASAEPKIAASKYQAPADSGNTQIAKVEKPKSPVKVLPHTASSLPILLLLGVIATFGATFLTFRRVFPSAVLTS